MSRICVTNSNEQGEDEVKTGADTTEKGSTDQSGKAGATSTGGWWGSRLGWVTALSAVMQRRELEDSGSDSSCSDHEDNVHTLEEEDGCGTTQAKQCTFTTTLVCTPWRVRKDIPQLERAKQYAVRVLFALAAMQDSLRKQEAPVLPQLQFTPVLNASVIEDRQRGLTATQALVLALKQVVVYTNLGITSGMKEVMSLAKVHGKKVVLRELKDFSPPNNVELAQFMPLPPAPTAKNLSPVAVPNAANLDALVVSSGDVSPGTATADSTSPAAAASVTSSPVNGMEELDTKPSSAVPRTPVTNARLKQDTALLHRLSNKHDLLFPSFTASLMWHPDTCDLFLRFAQASRAACSDDVESMTEL